VIHGEKDTAVFSTRLFDGGCSGGTINGNVGNNTLWGGPGDNTLREGGGNDTLWDKGKQALHDKIAKSHVVSKESTIVD